MVVWRIEMLGGLRLSYSGKVIDRFPTQRTAALLAFLALHPRTPHSREVLGEILWPEADPESQRHSLRLALSRLRKLLGADHPLVAGRLSVGLDRARFVTDVAEFEGAVARGDSRSAKRLYTGALLPGFYEDWVVEEQLRLELLSEELGDADRLLPKTLPRDMGPLIGREAERKAVNGLIREGRIVTLTGLGGMGKSRLATTVARDNGRGVWVPLADLSDAGQVADSIRGALHLPAPAPGFAVEDLVAGELTELAPVLLVLDNAEHLLGAQLTRLVQKISNVAGVALLLTSRRPLGIAHEIEVPVGPLEESEGAALFEDRARRLRPDLTASEDAMRAFANKVGGMPLALELAAARAGVQDLAQLEFLDWTAEGDFGESLGIPERHRALDDVLESSLALLPQASRSAFCRLAVFRGGFDANAAKVVASAGLSTLETLRRWALIRPFEESDGSLRFRMPEPLRELAAKESKDASILHARYFADWVEANRADDLPPPPYEFGLRLALQERERDNVRTALEVCRQSQDPRDRETGLRIVAAFWTHWYIRNAGQEMEGWASSLLSGPGELADPLIRASARLSLALAIRERGAHDASAKEVSEALEILLDGPRDRNLAFAWHLRGLSLADLSQFEEADVAYKEAEAIWSEIGDARNHSITRHNRGMLAAQRGNPDAAEALVSEAMEVFRQHNSTYTAIANSTMGSVRRARGDLAGAVAAFSEASRIHRQMGYMRGWAQNERDLALCLHGLGRADEASRSAYVALEDFRRVGDRHGEATALAAIALVTGETWHADEARGLLARHELPKVGELLESL